LGKRCEIRESKQTKGKILKKGGAQLLAAVRFTSVYLLIVFKYPLLLTGGAMQSFTRPFRFSVLMVFFILAFCGSSLFAQTGKISGQVKDRSTNEPLPGVNVIIEGTNLGAATDEDGFFFIINIPPGVYTLKTQMIGYATYIMENAKVSINRTTTANFMLESETIEGQTVVVEATRPVVQLDVSSSQRIVTDETIQDRPLENFEPV
jgi:hypothetical protein